MRPPHGADDGAADAGGVGVLERHPRLRVAALEAGCGWLLYWLWRLDEVVHKHFKEELDGRVRLKPSEYFRRQYFVTLEPDEPYLPQVLQQLGDGKLLLAWTSPIRTMARRWRGS